MSGAPTFGQVHDSSIQGNHFTRDGSYQANAGTVHSFTPDFAYRVAVFGNTFDVVNGPITNVLRNDGETILPEGDGGQPTENLGTVASATATTISDHSNTINVDPFSTGTIPEDYGVAIVSGTRAGQIRRVVSYSQPTMTVDRAWDVVPDATSHYATFVWGLEKSVILGNTLSQNPRAIWLYETAIREVEVSSNAISQGGGIFLRTRAWPQSSSCRSTTCWSRRIRSPTPPGRGCPTSIPCSSTPMPCRSGSRRSASRSARIRWSPTSNVCSAYEDFANVEGCADMMRVQSSTPYQTSVMPRLLGTIFNGNACTNCNTAIRIGTGAGGTTILNTQLVNSPNRLADWATTNPSETSSGTVQSW